MMRSARMPHADRREIAHINNLEEELKSTRDQGLRGYDSGQD